MQDNNFKKYDLYLFKIWKITCSTYISGQILFVESYFLLNDDKFESPCSSFHGLRKLEWIKENYGSLSGFNLNEEAVEKAMKIINDKYAFISILEEDIASTKRFEDIFNTVLKKKEAKHKHSSKKVSVSQELVNMIQDRNQLDMKIYNLVKDKLLSVI